MRVKLLCFLIVLLLFSAPVFSSSNLSLSESINLALTNNPEIIVAQRELEAAQGKIGQAVSLILPRLRLEGGIGKMQMDPQTAQIEQSGGSFLVRMGTGDEYNARSYQATLTQPLFTSGKILMSIDIANKNYIIFEQELRRTKDLITFQVKSSYYGVILAKELKELGVDAHNMAKTHLKHVKALFATGIATKADILRAEVQVANAEVNLTKVKNNHIVAQNAFNNVLGRDLDTPVNLEKTKTDLSKKEKIDYKEILKVAYKYRPEWIQFKLGKDIAKDNVHIQSVGYFPDISLLGTYGNNRFEHPLYVDDTKNWKAMVVGSWNIFDSFDTLSKIKEAKAKLMAQEANQIRIKNAIALEVKDACFNLMSAKDTLASSKKALELAKENYRIADLRYQAGVGTNIEVIDAQVALTKAQVEYSKTKFEYQISKAKINRVVGRDVYSSHGEEIITLIGEVFYSDLEGGMIAFIDKDNQNYQLIGKLITAQTKNLKTHRQSKRAMITGYIRSDIISSKMWGMPFEVATFDLIK